MSDALKNYQTQLTKLLAEKAFSAAVDMWMRAAEEIPNQHEGLLLLAQEIADAGAENEAAELVLLLIPTLREKKKWTDLLWALKLLVRLHPRAKDLRKQLVEAYEKVFADDARLSTIFQQSGLLDNARHLDDVILSTDALLALKEGSYCQHKSWGFGRVAAFDAALGVIRVDFKERSGHNLQLAYAAESLTPLPADHIAVRKAVNLTEVQKLGADDPVALIKIVLHSFERQATADQIEAALTPDVFPADKWKRWFDNVKKLLKKNPHIGVPAKKSEPFVMREVPVSVQEELLSAFEEARGLKARVAVAEELLKQVDEIADAELLLQEFLNGLLAAMRSPVVVERPLLLEAAIICNELRLHQKNPTSTEFPQAVRDSVQRLDMLQEQLESLPVSRHTSGITTARALLGEPWAQSFLRLLPRVSMRLVAEIAEQLAANGAGEQLKDFTLRAVYGQSASADWLLWLCKIRSEPKWDAIFGQMFNQRFFLALLGGLESERARFPGAKGSKLIDFIMADKELIAELLEAAPAEDIRDAARSLLASPAVDEMTKRSLMARIIKLRPETQQLLTGGEEAQKPETLIVSWPSFERRKAEFDDIINKKIPQNARDIAQARSYGDLRENFEFKAAKEAQRLLNRRRSELERDLDRARPTYFEDSPTEHIGVGAHVKVTEVSTGKKREYYILGTWDSDLQRNIISYRTPLAQAMLNKKVGDEVELEIESHREHLRIESFEKVAREFLEKL